MTYLTETGAQTARISYRYFCELASLEVDFEGLSLHYQVIDVVVLEPTEQAIKNLIASAGWLRGYILVKFWAPQPDLDGDAPF